MSSWLNTYSYKHMKISWMVTESQSIQECWQMDGRMGSSDISSWPNTYSYKNAWRYPQQLLSYGTYKNVWKNNQRGITWKLRKGEHSFLCKTYYCDLIHIPIKLHEDIPNGYWVMAHTRILEKINQRGIAWKLRRGNNHSCGQHIVLT